MNSTSEAILALKPVTFHYKSDNTNTPQFGLIAEEVAEGETRTSSCATRTAKFTPCATSGERNVAQRVSQRAPKSSETGGDDHAINERFPNG